MDEIILWTCAATILALFLLMIKNHITSRNLHIILYAICAYNDDVKHRRVSSVQIPFDSMASYYKVLFRLWDWGYKHILPKDKYELIKTYIKR